MKILHINKDYGDNGGTEQYLYNLCAFLEAHGHRTVVVYGRQDANTWHTPQRSEHFVPGIHEFSNRANRRVLESCLEIVRKEQPNVINLHMTFNPSLAYKLVAQWPVVQSVHSPHSYCLRYKLFQSNDTACNRPLGYHCLLAAYLKRCADPRPWNLVNGWRQCNAEMQSTRSLDHLIAFSKYIKTCLIQNGIKEHRITVLPYFAQVDRNKRDNECSDENIILYVGRVTKEKGLDYLLRAAKRISVNYRLLIVGDGWHLGHIKNLAHQLDLADHVEFTGWLSNKDLTDYYARSSVLVIPSSWPEPFGIVGLEAMSHARPVVAFNVGGVADWLDHEQTGFLVEPRNIAEMAARISQLLNNKKLAAQMGENGRKRAEQAFSASGHLQELMRIYETARRTDQGVRIH